MGNRKHQMSLIDVRHHQWVRRLVIKWKILDFQREHGRRPSCWGDQNERFLRGWVNRFSMESSKLHDPEFMAKLYELYPKQRVWCVEETKQFLMEMPERITTKHPLYDKFKSYCCELQTAYDPEFKREYNLTHPKSARYDAWKRELMEDTYRPDKGTVWYSRLYRFTTPGNSAYDVAWTAQYFQTHPSELTRAEEMKIRKRKLRKAAKLRRLKAWKRQREQIKAQKAEKERAAAEWKQQAKLVRRSPDRPGPNLFAREVRACEAMDPQSLLTHLLDQIRSGQVKRPKSLEIFRQQLNNLTGQSFRIADLRNYNLEGIYE